jgi:hypothetical protein
MSPPDLNDRFVMIIPAFTRPPPSCVSSSSARIERSCCTGDVLPRARERPLFPTSPSQQVLDCVSTCGQNRMLVFGRVRAALSLHLCHSWLLGVTKKLSRELALSLLITVYSAFSIPLIVDIFVSSVTLVILYIILRADDGILTGAAVHAMYIMRCIVAASRPQPHKRFAAATSLV